MSDWSSAKPHGIRVGPDATPITTLEFTDFECPYCRQTHKSLDSLRKAKSTLVSWVFVHFPLTMHRFARPAANVAECAGHQRKFDAMQALLFDKQDSLGLKSWGSYASEIGIADTIAFDRCVRTERFSRIDSGIAVGGRPKVDGTPTMFINGWRFTALPGDNLGHIIDRMLAGKPAIDTVGAK